jgi:hypothetical protein
MEKITKKIEYLIEINRKQGRRGIAIYLAAVTLSIVLTAAFGTSLIALYQLKNVNEAGKSVIAFAAAETGIEWSLAYVDETNYGSECPENLTLGNGATYTVYCDLCGPSNEYLCIRSEGTYKGTQRTIKIQR